MIHGWRWNDDEHDSDNRREDLNQDRGKGRVNECARHIPEFRIHGRRGRPERAGGPTSWLDVGIHSRRIGGRI